MNVHCVFFFSSDKFIAKTKKKFATKKKNKRDYWIHKKFFIENILNVCNHKKKHTHRFILLSLIILKLLLVDKIAI